MAPPKFDDFSKAATEVLNDDYQTSGHQLQAKQKTSFDGAVVTTAVDLFGKDCATPAKLTWKFPSPFGLKGVSVDKVELDKAGKFKFEAVIDNGLHTVKDLKVELKSDLVDVSKASAGFTFTGLPDTQVKFETKSDMKFGAEVTRNQGPATVGVKFGADNLTAPDVGAKFVSGPLTASIFAKKKFQAFSAFAAYTASDALKVAAKVEQGGKGPEWGVGASYTVQKGTTVKAKLIHDSAISLGLKHQVVPGMTLFAGGKFDLAYAPGASHDTAGDKRSYGIKVSIE